MAQGIVMFSGGLDSTIAVHLLKAQGIDILALHFMLPFYSGLGLPHSTIRNYAEKLCVPLRLEEEGEEYLEMIKDPSFGFGKNANPCLDCRIHRMKKAKKIMQQEGASFIATGEVIGQRPMSQRLECLHLIEKRTELKGQLLRPLSAKLLEPTVPEQQGLVKRDLLLEIHGRSRKEQLAYAKAHCLSHSAPAGGCSLTNIETGARYMEMADRNPDFTINDFKLLAWGRHFRLNDTKLVVSRDQTENGILEKLVIDGDIVLDVDKIPGPFAILRGNEITEDLIHLAASISARYSKARDAATVPVTIKRGNASSILDVKPAPETLSAELRIYKGKKS